MKKIFTLFTAIALTTAASADTVWDFTVLPTQTIDGTGNLGTNAVFVEDDGAAWAIAYNLSGIEDGTEFTSKAGEVFEPTKGLVWSALPNEKMVIYRNYPTNYGGKYLFMNKACEVMIPAKAGQVIEIVAGTAKNNKRKSPARMWLRHSPPTMVRPSTVWWWTERSTTTTNPIL